MNCFANTLNLPLQINNLLLKLVAEVSALAGISKIVLYGSYATGNYNDDSDIDIAIFTKDTDHNTQGLYRQVYKICNKLKFDIQPQIFSENELIDPIGIVEEIDKYGIDITKLNCGA